MQVAHRSRRTRCADFGLKERRGAAGRRSVESGGPAAKAGMEPGDVILEFNGQPVKSSDDLVRMVDRDEAGHDGPVKVLRDKQEKTLNVTRRGAGSRGREPPGGVAARRPGGERRRLRHDARRSHAVDGAAPGRPLRHAGRGRDRCGRRRRRDAGGADDRATSSCRSTGSRWHRGRGQPRCSRECPSGGRAYFLVWRRGQEIFVSVRKD